MYHIDLSQVTEIYAIAPLLLVPLIMAGVQAAAGATKGIMANKRKKNAQNELANFQRQQLKTFDPNSFNKERRDFFKKQAGMALGTSASAAMQGGARTAGIMGGAQDRYNDALMQQSTLETQADIQDANSIVQQQVRNQSMIEQREAGDINQLRGEVDAAYIDQQAGWDDALGGVSSAGAYVYDDMKYGGSPGGGPKASGIGPGQPPAPQTPKTSGYVPRGNPNFYGDLSEEDIALIGQDN